MDTQEETREKVARVWQLLSGMLGFRVRIRDLVAE